MKEIQLSLLVVLCTELVRDCRLTYVCYTTKAWPEEQVAHASARRSATCTLNSFITDKIASGKSSTDLFSLGRMDGFPYKWQPISINCPLTSRGFKKCICQL